MDKQTYDKASDILRQIDKNKKLLSDWNGGTLGASVRENFEGIGIFPLLDTIVREKLTNKINELNQTFREL